eukprot:GFYU01010122.1.p1 GENE.GFYU01010122.1~~GFYU01010122.1.p1  ORF type:complete len:109 (-),score=12.87 GFYU01010122.1:20-346(-)
MAMGKGFQLRYRWRADLLSDKDSSGKTRDTVRGPTCPEVDLILAAVTDPFPQYSDRDGRGPVAPCDLCHRLTASTFILKEDDCAGGMFHVESRNPRTWKGERVMMKQQ